MITIGNFASRVLGFLFIPFYTSVLTTDEYGIADLITTTVSLLFPLFTVVICEAMMRFALDKVYDKKKIWNIGVWVWGIGFIVLLIMSPLIHLIPTLSPYSTYLLLYYLSYSLNFNASYFVRGIEKVRLYAISGMLQTAFTVGLNLFFLLGLKMGLKGYLLSYIIANLFTSFVLIFGAKIYRYPLSVPDVRLLKEMLTFSVPLIPNQIGWWINKSADKYFLLAICGTSLTGIYSVAHKIPSILYVLISIFSSAWRISAVDEYGTEENVKFFNDIYNKYLTVSLVAASFLIVINKVIARFLYAKDFYSAYVYVPTLILAVLFNGLGEYLGSIYITYKRTRPLMVTTLIGALINILLNAILIPKYEGMGAAAATLIGFAALWIIRCIDSRKIMKLQIDIFNSASCIVLLLAQTIIWLTEFRYAFYVNIVFFLTIMYLRRDFVSIAIDRFRRFRKK